MQSGDRVYFVCDASHLHRAMASFGHEEPEARSVVIAGGGAIGHMVGREMKERFPQGNHKAGKVVLEVDDLHAVDPRTERKVVRGVSFELQDEATRDAHGASCA